MKKYIVRIVKLSVAVVSCTLFMLACNKEDDEVILTHNYLPLEIGNYWQFDFMEKEEITGTKIIDGDTFYILQYLDDSSFYRIENDKVYVAEYSGQPSLKFNLSAEIDDTWNYGLYSVKMVSKTDTICINDQKIVNCYSFYFDVPGMVDEEHMIWLAPGIGFIQKVCGECLHPVRKLNEAEIDGQILNF